MSIPIYSAERMNKSLKSKQMQNLFAQSYAKYILKEVNEVPENYPEFDKKLNEKVTFTAYSLLASSCSLIEQGAVEEGIDGLVESASLLLNVHRYCIQDSPSSRFHVLISSMAFYAAGHYSQSYVSIKQVETQTEIAAIISAFIKKDFRLLIRNISAVLLKDNPKFEDLSQVDEWAISKLTAKAFSYILEYIFSGNSSLFIEAKDILKDALVIAREGNMPAAWCTIRLLRLMFNDLHEASPWQNLPQLFDGNPSKFLDRYISSLAHSLPPVIELWKSQRDALIRALDFNKKGCVINLRTGAGKTRLAELSILKLLSTDPLAKILYIAPFRSLAFEVEKVLSSTFHCLGFQVSNLYGGFRMSSIDSELISESSIIIATPEKAKALFRASSILYINVKLIIIDEGHLLGPDERNIRNEAFYDHLRAFANSTGVRLLLLSAVLPNSQELAEWITEDPNAVITSNWKPSAERFGFLNWNGHRIKVEWFDKFRTFNPKFIEAKPINLGRRRKPFPSNSNEAIAATAVKLSSSGPVMIFTARAVSVQPIAESVITALGINPVKHSWPEREWEVFEAACSEDLESNSIIRKAASLGIICHCNRLSTQVRLAMERLMRSYPPKIIIATTTLAQGVNVGISSVIVTNPYINQTDRIDHKDFWNICGRAGRAFIDREGKILYFIDETKKQWQVKKNIKLANSYFNPSLIDKAESGILYILKYFIKLAKQSGVSFSVLIEHVANNTHSAIFQNASELDEVFDLIDDELLALHENEALNQANEDSADWMEAIFIKSLAAIQARNPDKGITVNEVVDLLKARTMGIVSKVPDVIKRKSIIASGLPLSVALLAYNDLNFFREISDDLVNSEMSIITIIKTVGKLEDWARVNAKEIVDGISSRSELAEIREMWLMGIGLSRIERVNSKANFICSSLYEYQLPWLIHAISQKLDPLEEDERIKVLSKLALFVELGVPNELAAKLFLAGIQSRTAAVELSHLELDYGGTLLEITGNLQSKEFCKLLLDQVSPETAIWINLVLESNPQQIKAPKFPNIEIDNLVDEDIALLYARRDSNGICLCTIDGRIINTIGSNIKIPFEQIVDDPRYALERVNKKVWRLVVRDPRYE